MAKASNYPHGFNSGVLIRQMLHDAPSPRRIMYVGNNSVVLPGEKAAVDGDLNNLGGTFLHPFATIDYAIGRAKSGDVILVRPGHTETVSAAAGIDVDVDGISIIGLGQGSRRPTITFGTSVAASLHLDADDVLLENLLFVNDIDQQNHMIDIASASTTAKDCVIRDCEFREGSSKQALSFITADAADNCADRLHIVNCRFYAPTAGDGDNAISIAKDMDGVRIHNCEVYGDFDEACIDVPAGGNAQVDMIISDCKLTNLLTGQHAIQISGTSSTGKIIDCYVETDSLSTSVDAGGLEMFNVRYHDGTDQGAPVDVATPLEPGESFVVKKALTSSAIVTGGVDVTGTASGDVMIEDIIFETDGTGLATGTNFTLEKDGGSGVLTFFGEAVANLGANKTEVLSTGSVTASNGTVLESGQKLVAKCTSSSCTGSGVITLYLKCKRIASGADVAAA